MKRSAGILLPVSSLASEYGIGCFDEKAYEFVDFLKNSGQSYWQILPLGPTGYGDSPYQSFSTFAGNPYFISLGELVKEGLLTKKDCDKAGFSDKGRIDYAALYRGRIKLLKQAFTQSNINGDKGFQSFCLKNSWLSDYALFMALKEHFGSAPWSEWEKPAREKKPKAIEEYSSLLSEQITFYKFLQYKFFEQWRRLKSYANKKGIKIIGDIPIYVAFDSADVWAAPELFQLGDNRMPTAVAGCPPDGFSEDGQLWGNPLYDWDYHRKTSYEWWIKRLAHCFELYDVVRIDHFRGFDEYYSIPSEDKTAKNGHWEKGPGIELFRAVGKALGNKEVIAEDLGFMTDSVRRLVRESGFPNMKVLEFAFDSRDTGSRNDYLPHNYNENCVAYTGTHDNQPIASWFEAISEKERKMARDYLSDHFTPPQKLHRAFISLLMRSNARLCVIPMQDWLGLGDESRINTPSTASGNWQWRLESNQLTPDLEKEIFNITSIFGRN